MARLSLLLLLCFLLLLASVPKCHCQERKVHIVYMGDRPDGEGPLKSMHHSMLERVLGSASLAEESLVYNYDRSFNGFAARLTAEEAQRFSEMEGVVSVFPNRVRKLHTTRSWDFMGLSEARSGYCQEGDVIVGLLDTGIWPESESFRDEGLARPPHKWKGECHGANFTCNNKLIGARYYNCKGIYTHTDFKSPRDSEGHGTHASSTAAGRKAHEASFLGLAEGVARGGVPGARIAVYKVCWSKGCYDADILKAFDVAIADGVDILSVSFGSDKPLEYCKDAIAIGAFQALKRGILTAASGGNAGSEPATITNTAPWLLTVAASTIDRRFATRLLLGNGEAFAGQSVNAFELDGTSFPLIWGGDAANFSAKANSDISRYCKRGSLNLYKLGGAIVLCDRLVDGSDIIMADGVGVIMALDSPLNTNASSFALSAIVVSIEDRRKILEYIKSTKNPMATILRSKTWKDAMAPIVATFSSRGPNPITPGLLKPDLTAPGVDILAAWSPVSPPSWNPMDTRRVKYNIISGTSISCSHVAGAAAYVKAAHPYWSPAAIKSALMTTASVVDEMKHNDHEFAYGSGHLDPVAALKPGLVFNMSISDYEDFLCEQGYSHSTLRLVHVGNHTACDGTDTGRGRNLNYPSFTLAIEDGKPITGFFVRTVTNVGLANSTYTASIDMPDFISVEVEPLVLSFSAVGQKKRFTVFVVGPRIWQQPITSGAIVWEDGTHVVRTPLVVYTTLPKHSPDYPYSIAKKKGGDLPV